MCCLRTRGARRARVEGAVLIARVRRDLQPTRKHDSSKHDTTRHAREPKHKQTARELAHAAGSVGKAALLCSGLRRRWTRVAGAAAGMADMAWLAFGGLPAG